MESILFICMNQGLAGLTVGMIVFFCALGLTLAFGALKIINLAHGSVFMVGLYLCFSISRIISISCGFWIGVLAAVIGTFIVGYIMEIIILRPIYKRHSLDQFMITFAATFIFMDLVKIVWGTEYHTILPPPILGGSLNIAGVILPLYNFFIILLGFITYVLIYCFIEKTLWGVTIRGITVDRDMMSALGTNVTRAYSLTFSLACGLSGLGGALIGPMTCVAPGIDSIVLLESFIIIVIGGLGSITGAFIGSILFGLVNSFGILFFPKMAIGFPFILMLVVLLIRPFGLMGKPVK